MRGVFAIPHTCGFLDHKLRLQHWGKHGSDFGAPSVVEYERIADAFLSQAKLPHFFECSRTRNRALVRYDTARDTFGVLARDGTIQTCFKPIPCAVVPAAMRRTTRKCHPFATNLEYAEDACLR
jgi:hypothetical protein